MRLLIIPFTLVVLFGGIAAYIWMQSRSGGEFVDLRGLQEVSIVLSDKGFTPRNVTVDKGTVVVFSTTRPYQFWPASNEHPSHTIYSAFDPQRPIDPDATWAFTFEGAGEWRFHDHVRSYYTGTIYVESFRLTFGAHALRQFHLPETHFQHENALARSALFCYT